MKDLKRLIVSGLVLAGVAATTYRAYELNKLRKSVKEQVIEIEVENQK